MAIGWITNSDILGHVLPGQSANFTVEASTLDPAVTYTVSSGTLPSGVALAGATGALTGNAPAAATETAYNFTISANSTGGNTTRTFSMVVNSAPALIPVNKPTGYFIGGVETYTGGGGYNGKTYKFDYATDTIYTQISSGPGGGSWAHSGSGGTSTKGYIIGGGNNGAGWSGQCGWLAYSNDTWSFFGWTLLQMGGSGVQNLTNIWGYGNGGYGNTSWKIDFATDSRQTAPTFPSNAGSQPRGCGTINEGYMVSEGGSHNAINKIPYTTEVYSALPATTTKTQNEVAVINSGYAGYKVGGQSSTTVEKFTYSTETPAMIGATAAYGQTHAGGNSGTGNLTSGWICPQHDGGFHNTVDKCSSYATETFVAGTSTPTNDGAAATT
jgi:hypothetical protein